MGTPTVSPSKVRSGVPRWLRAVIPALLILVWLSVGGIGGPYFGKISQVSSNDATSYLPASSDATKVQNLEVKFAAKKVLPAVVLYVRSDGLTAGDRTYITDRITAIKSASGVSSGVSPAIASKDGRAVEIVVPVKDNTALNTSVSNLRAVIAKDAPKGLTGIRHRPGGSDRRSRWCVRGNRRRAPVGRDPCRVRHPDHRLPVAAAPGTRSPHVDLCPLRGDLRNLASGQGWRSSRSTGRCRASCSSS